MDKFIQYLKDVKNEMLKVTWPNRDEIIGATLLVIILSLVMAIFVYGCDKVLLLLVGLLLNRA
ncbi:MAG: preprotein translocase subunit SecE [Chitinispirillaceae bacterium]|nr:preprotein translocase subunit SecE [Chitinispirillaceae bacterium]